MDNGLEAEMNALEQSADDFEADTEIEAGVSDVYTVESALVEPPVAEEQSNCLISH